MTLFEFIQWCFRTPMSGLVTIIVGAGIFEGAARIVFAFRGKQ